MDKQEKDPVLEMRKDEVSAPISRRDALKRMAKIALGVGAAGAIPSVLAACYDDYYDYDDYYGYGYDDYYYYSDYYNYDDYYDYYYYYNYYDVYYAS
jgi:hypothetical protein